MLHDVKPNSFQGNNVPRFFFCHVDCAVIAIFTTVYFQITIQYFSCIYLTPVHACSRLKMLYTERKRLYTIRERT